MLRIVSQLGINLIINLSTVETRGPRSNPREDSEDQARITRKGVLYFRYVRYNFDFIPAHRVLLFHTSDENGPEGELEWEI